MSSNGNGDNILRTVNVDTASRSSYKGKNLLTDPVSCVDPEVYDIMKNENNVKRKAYN